LFRIVPKIGPLRAFAFKVPTPQAEKLFLASFDDTQQCYQSLLNAAGLDELKFQNDNFDIGQPTSLGNYRLAAETNLRPAAGAAPRRLPLSNRLPRRVVPFDNLICFM